MNDTELALKRFKSLENDYLEDLKDLVRIPSISADQSCAGHVRESAEKTAEIMKRRGLENVEVIDLKDAHPYAYGEWCRAKGRPTLLCYAHHDVQPTGYESLWKTKPFTPTLGKDGRLYARGAADDKAGVVALTSAIDSYIGAVKSLPVNVKLIIEGEEEIGSSHLTAFLKKYRKKLAADVMVLTDTSNFETGVPSITTSLRGLVAVDVEVRSLRQSVHSGGYGGPTPDAAMALVKLLATLTDKDGDIAIARMYDKVRPLTADEKKMLDGLNPSEKEFRKQAGIVASSRVMGKGGAKNILQKMWRLPALSINAMEAANMKERRNVIVERASARVGIRIVPDMEREETLNLLEGHLRENAPWGVEVSVNRETSGNWWTTDTKHPAFEAARRALAKGYGRPAVFTGCGGSIPFVEPFSRELGGVPALLVGIEDPYTNAHSENESLHLGDWKKSIAGIIHLFQELAGD
ncbi:MAG: M20/M25/M40 family metallo-hydrolase [Candidatus Wallbacteria bacterium]|nr:M20/M25/M40 family metallo-hydrolase [Candidatus Wallbacteria bacterium]